ncbi:hypothetical protein BC831DRAFT_491564, partial [Entophlyctis helioformis]
MWVGIGWGSSMLTSDSLVAYANRLSRRVAVASHRQNHRPAVQRHDQTVIGEVLIVEFRRPTMPDNKPAVHIFAFKPNPHPDSLNGWLAHHGPHRGAYAITLATGVGYLTAPDDIVAKRVHGASMAVTWLVLFPISIFYVRYLKSVSGWLLVHMYIQASGGSLGIVVAGIYLVFNLGNNFGAGPKPGLLGIFNRQSLSTEHDAVDRSRFLPVLLLAAFAQVGLGIQTLYPLSETKFRGRGFWIAYFFVVLFWAMLFVLTDVYYQYRVANPSPKRKMVRKMVTAVPTRDDTGFGSASTLPGGKDGEVGSGVVAIVGLDRYAKEHSLAQSFTWDSIDRYVASGHMLVVANGRYVFDIESWLAHHPGGRLILHMVAGTDITIDYYNEAGYDAAAFMPQQPDGQSVRSRLLPKAQDPQQQPGTVDGPTGSPNLGGGNPRSPQAASALKQSMTPPSDLRLSKFAEMSGLTDREWKHVIRARRTHVHTRMAIARLSTLMVGELVPSNSDGHRVNARFSRLVSQFSNQQEATGETIFDPAEYRRYALVASTLETPTGTTTPTYRLKFLRAPDLFFPGESVEIQCRVEGKCVSRYYTPINGNPNSFEVLVK